LRNWNRAWLRNRHRYMLLKDRDNIQFMIIFCSLWCSSSFNETKNQLFITYLILCWNRNWYRTWLRNRNRAWLWHWLRNRNTTKSKEKC
jgi:hypothetical protein